MRRTKQIEEAASELGLQLLWKDSLKPGDLYLACRNTGPQLLTVKSVNEEHGYVIPVENAYPYDIHECVKVTEQ
jgi:hypothetical protein